jgi:ssDNA-binding Zn-finger/Zn-ribbon topoisomerase 1
MKSAIPCDKCGSTGLVIRDGEEAKSDMHPSLSREKGLCDKCGGSGVVYQSRATPTSQVG